MDKLEIKGTIIDVLAPVEKGNFKKQEIAIETEGQYPQKLLIEFVNDKIDLIDSVIDGDKVVVSVNLRGRSWDSDNGTKYFMSLSGWKIKVEE